MSELEQYQRRCRTWAIECFGKHYALAQDERSFRFLEEALELVQASGLSYNDVMNSVDYVFNRAAGTVGQEAGGTIITLALLCESNGVSLQEEALKEIERCEGKTETIRAKHAMKPQRIRGAV